MKSIFLVIETTQLLWKNRQSFYKHLLSVIISVAAVMILQCLSKTVFPSLFLYDQTEDEISSFAIRVDSDERRLECELLSEPEITSVLRRVCDCMPSFTDSFCEGTAEGLTETCNVLLMRASSGYWDLNPEILLHGKGITDTDWRCSSGASVISVKTALALFGSENPIGEKFSVKTKQFGRLELYVSGICASETLKDNQKEYLYICETYARNHCHAECSQYQKLRYRVYGSYQKKEIENALIAFRHKIEKKGQQLVFEADSDVTDPAIGMINLMTGILTIFAVLAFLLSMISIMNMTLISVSKRTREFGVRKAIGAQNSDIRLQIMTESVLVSVAGTCFGILIGILIGNLVILIVMIGLLHGEKSFSLYFPFKSALLTGLGALLLSMLFATIPSRKAASMVITEAINKYE